MTQRGVTTLLHIDVAHTHTHKKYAEPNKIKNRTKPNEAKQDIFYVTPDDKRPHCHKMVSINKIIPTSEPPALGTLL